MILPSKDTFYPPPLSHLFFFSSSFLPSFSLCFFLSFVREGFPRGRGRFTERTIYNRKGSRISSTVGRKIRYRFPSSKLSTLVRVGGKARDAIRPTGNSLARLRFLLCCLETLGAALPRVRAPFYEFRTTRMRSLRAIHTYMHIYMHTLGTGTGTETGSKTCGHLERERVESSSMWDDALALLYANSFIREPSRKKFQNR